jgi:hypothetical protein
MYGAAWVQTSNVDGLAWFGAIGTGDYLYAGWPQYTQPHNGGVPYELISANISGNATGWVDASDHSLGAADWGNGPKYGGETRAMMLPFASADLIAAAGDAAKRNNSYLNPASYTNMHAIAPDLIAPNTVTNPASALYGEPNHIAFSWGNTVIFDSTTNQLIVVIDDYYTMKIMAFYQVR